MTSSVREVRITRTPIALHRPLFPPFLKFPGGHSGGVPPVPIPNTAVKPASAENTRGASPRKDRSPPGSSQGPNPCGLGPSLFVPGVFVPGSRSVWLLPSPTHRANVWLHHTEGRGRCPARREWAAQGKPPRSGDCVTNACFGEISGSVDV